MGRGVDEETKFFNRTNLLSHGGLLVSCFSYLAFVLSSSVPSLVCLHAFSEIQLCS